MEVCCTCVQKNSGAFKDWHSLVHNSQDILFRGIVFIYHRGKGDGARKIGGGESFDSQGERGGIGRSQQSVKGEYGNFIAN